MCDENRIKQLDERVTELEGKFDILYDLLEGMARDIRGIS